MIVGTVLPPSMKLLSGSMVIEYRLSCSHCLNSACTCVSPVIHAGDISDTISPPEDSNWYMCRT